MPTSFQYKTDSDHNNLANLVIGQANNAVSDKKHKNPIKNDLILNYTQANNIWYAQVGIPTGVTVSNTYWPDWADSNAIVHQVKWISPIVVVPNDIMAKRSMSMSTKQVEEVIDYIMDIN